ncbi:MAG: CDP-diacylglycerol--serine O-phosphatidyltransferase, partial [Deltaproteobacteria bacterium]|nr:CDP-diacylglycerol--serine O-phosphatidyltransferase [Deltaproteobacteria bacterium]
ACVVASTQWFVSFLGEYGIHFAAPEWLLAGGVATLGLLMVSAIPYRSSKEIDVRHSYGTLVFVVVALAFVVAEPSVSLFVIGIVYVFSGPVEWCWRRLKHRPLEELPASAPTEQPSEG